MVWMPSFQVMFRFDSNGTIDTNSINPEETALNDFLIAYWTLAKTPFSLSLSKAEQSRSRFDRLSANGFLEFYENLPKSSSLYAFIKFQQAEHPRHNLNERRSRPFSPAGCDHGILSRRPAFQIAVYESCPLYPSEKNQSGLSKAPMGY
jgi:hypothetical protein